ncbi:MAG: DUF805 domain-containing protein [Halioglobus sp.]
MEYFSRALQKYAEFSGRDTRQQFWMFVLFNLIFAILVAMVGGLLETNIPSQLYSLALLIPNLSIGARRLHDTGRSGWWQLIGIIPVIGIIVLIIFFVQDSVEDNEYGPNPKATPA